MKTTYFLTSLYGNAKSGNIDKDYIFIITKTRAEAKVAKAVNNSYGRIEEYTADTLRAELNSIYKDCAGLNYRVIDLVTPALAGL